MKVPLLLKYNESLKKHCTLKIGGQADYFAEPSTPKELYELLAFARAKQMSFVVIGRGSNVLFADEGFRGLIIKFGKKFSSVRVNENNIIAQAGAWMPYVARLAQINGLAGLEHTVGIPGTVAGMVVMNAGSQRKRIGESVISVRGMLPDGTIETLSVADCGFGYRQSIFQQEAKIVIGVTIGCKKSDPRSIRKEMLTILRERRRKFPRKEPNCGSVFKSDPKKYEKYGPPGKIIEDLGFKGKSIGGIVVSEKHANFFLNRSNGSAKDFLKLVDNVEAAAYQINKIYMDKEVRYVPHQISHSLSQVY